MYIKRCVNVVISIEYKSYDLINLDDGMLVISFLRQIFLQYTYVDAREISSTYQLNACCFQYWIVHRAEKRCT